MTPKKKDSEKTDKELLAELKELRKEKRVLESENKELASKKSDDTPKIPDVQKSVEPVKPVVDEEYPQEEYIDIRPDAYIRVISLCPHPLNLSTAKEGGKKFRFEKIGQEKRILYNDIVDIIEAMPSFAESGVFFIADKNVVRRHGLDSFYDEILTKKEIEQVVTGDAELALTIFKTANARQKNYLAEMLIARMVAGDDVDRNFAHSVGEVIGIDIIKRAEESKEYKDVLISK